MKFYIKDFFSATEHIENADLVLFTEELLNGKLHFSVCSVGQNCVVRNFTSVIKVN